MNVKHMVAVAAAGFLLVVSSPTIAGAAVESFKDVVIRNTDAEPVPTRAIGPTAATQSGAWNVGVNNTVQGIAAFPTDRFQSIGQFPVTASNHASVLMFWAPDSKVAVIESISATLHTKPGQVPEVNVYVSAPDANGEFDRAGTLVIALGQQGEVGTGSSSPGFPYRVLSGTHSVHLYVPSGGALSTEWNSPVTGGDVSGTVTVNGYYLPSS